MGHGGDRIKSPIGDLISQQDAADLLNARTGEPYWEKHVRVVRAVWEQGAFLKTRPRFRDAQILALWLACWTQDEIAAAVGCDRVTVSEILSETAKLPKATKSQQLAAAHALVPKGQWLPWLREHFGLDQRTAYRYMALARQNSTSCRISDSGQISAKEASSFVTTESRTTRKAPRVAHADRKLAAQWINARTGEPYDQKHVFFVKEVWRRNEELTPQPRPRFRDAYNARAREGAPLDWRGLGA